MCMYTDVHEYTSQLLFKHYLTFIHIYVDLILKVHLQGSFMVTRAAWPHMRKNNYGRCVIFGAVKTFINLHSNSSILYSKGMHVSELLTL